MFYLLLFIIFRINFFFSIQNVYSKKLLSDDITTVSANELQFYTSLSATCLQVVVKHKEMFYAAVYFIHSKNIY